MSQPTQQELYDPVDEVIEVNDELEPNNIFIDDAAKEDKPKKVDKRKRDNSRKRAQKFRKWCITIHDPNMGPDFQAIVKELLEVCPDFSYICGSFEAGKEAIPEDDSNYFGDGNLKRYSLGVDARLRQACGLAWLKANRVFNNTGRLERADATVVLFVFLCCRWWPNALATICRDEQTIHGVDNVSQVQNNM